MMAARGMKVLCWEPYLDSSKAATVVGVGARIGEVDGGFTRGDGTLVGVVFGFLEAEEQSGTLG